MISTFKLFLEAYFDLVICTVLNNFAFLRNNHEAKKYFATIDDAICTITTIVFNFCILFFPYLCYRMIKLYLEDKKKENKKETEKEMEMDEFQSMIMEGINPKNYHASMYTFYFMMRKNETFNGRLGGWP